jgi:exonuclease III
MKDKKVIVMGDFNVAHNPIDTHKPDPRHPSFTKEER